MAVISSARSSNQSQQMSFDFFKWDSSISLRIFSYLDRSDYKSFNVSRSYNELACYASVIKERDNLQETIKEVINLFKYFRYLSFQTQINTLIEEENHDALKARNEIRKLKDSAIVSIMKIGAFLLQKMQYLEPLKNLNESHPHLFKYLDEEIEAYSSLNLNDLFFSKIRDVLKPKSLRSIEATIFDVKKSLVDNIPEEVFNAIDKKVVTFSDDLKKLGCYFHRVKVVLDIANKDSLDDRSNKLYLIVKKLLEQHLFMEAIDLIRHFKGKDSSQKDQYKISYRSEIIHLICEYLTNNNKLYRAIDVAQMNTNQFEVEKELVLMAMRFINKGMHKENKIVCSYLRPYLRKQYMSFK